MGVLEATYRLEVMDGLLDRFASRRSSPVKLALCCARATGNTELMRRMIPTSGWPTNGTELKKVGTHAP